MPEIFWEKVNDFTAELVVERFQINFDGYI